MLKPLEIEYQGHQVTLECTHKKAFPPPQMYGHSPEDVDTLWRQGAIEQKEYQLLMTWKDKCGLMVMGPRCLDCPLAKLQNPRPGRPEVVTTEPWLARKEKFRWEDMKAGKLATTNEEAKHTVPSKKETAQKMIDKGILESEPDSPPSTVPDKKPLEENVEPMEAGDETIVDEDLGKDIAAELSKSTDVDEDVIDALAED